MNNFTLPPKMLCNSKVKVAQVEVFKFCHKIKAEWKPILHIYRLRMVNTAILLACIKCQVLQGEKSLLWVEVRSHLYLMWEQLNSRLAGSTAGHFCNTCANPVSQVCSRNLLRFLLSKGKGGRQGWNCQRGFPEGFPSFLFQMGWVHSSCLCKISR